MNNYKKGYEKERKIVKRAREQGLIAFRSAGSHSKFDGVILDLNKGTIEFFQSKTGKMYDKLQDGSDNSIMKPLIEEFEALNRLSESSKWIVKFKIY